MISFKDYEEAYLEDMRRTYNYYVEHTTVSFDLSPLNAEQMRQAVVPPGEPFRSYVIFSEGEYAGYVLITEHKKKHAYRITGEVTLYLDERFTGKGVGKATLRFIDEVARKQSFHSLIATICAENVQSIRLFAGYGYVQVAHFREVGYKFGRLLDVVSYQKRFD